MATIFDGIADIARCDIRAARKVHTCSACHQTIPVGSRYASCAMLFDGRWDSWKRCDRCEAIYRHLLYKAQEGYWDAGIDERLDCEHDYVDAWGEDPPPEIAALAFALPGEVGLEVDDGE